MSDLELHDRADVAHGDEKEGRIGPRLLGYVTGLGLILIVVLVIGGSLWIMANLNHNMRPMDQIMQMQR